MHKILALLALTAVVLWIYRDRRPSPLAINIQTLMSCSNSLN